MAFVAAVVVVDVVSDTDVSADDELPDVELLLHAVRLPIDRTMQVIIAINCDFLINVTFFSIIFCLNKDC